MRKILIILAFILLVCTGCGIGSGQNNVGITELPGISDTPGPEASISGPEPTEDVSATPEPTESPSATPEPTESPSVTPNPTASATAKPKPTATVQPTQHRIKEDIPAYITAGLGKLGEMALVWERFYYLSYYNSVEDFSTPGTFNETTSTDLDGDGKKEKITIIGGKPYDGETYGDPNFSDITIDIDGHKLKLESETIYNCSIPFTLEGRVLDVDRNDGKKEILIEAFIEIGPIVDYIITYDDKSPRVIFKGELENRYYLFGLGYITAPEDYNTTSRRDIYYYELWKLKSDRSGFEPADNKYYPTLHQYFCWDDNGNWDESMAAPTQWTQDLYKEPGGSEKVSVEEGTLVFTGLYSKEGWLMILDAKGELLGWLDMSKVDFNEYTDYAFEPEGD